MNAARPVGKGTRLIALFGAVGMVAACGYGGHLRPTPQQGIQANFGTDQTASGPWGEYGTAVTAGTFEFSIDSLALQPGEPVYAPVALRASESVTSPVTVTLQPPLTTADSVADVLRYSVSDAPAPSCDAGGFGSPTVVEDRPLSSDGGSLTLQPGAIRTLCFRVEIPDGTSPLESGGLADTVALWEFRAEGETAPPSPQPGYDRCHSHSGTFFGAGWYFVHCWFFRWSGYVGQPR